MLTCSKIPERNMGIPLHVPKRGVQVKKGTGLSMCMYAHTYAFSPDTGTASTHPHAEWVQAST